MEIKNLGEAANRIKEAIRNNERIVLYGDADLDGVTSVIVLKEAMENLGREINSIYFPDREEEGYGISVQALNLLKKLSPALVVALDCGISNFEEIKLARELGFEVIVIDHHEILDELPEAEIIVDPKQPGDQYPFKELATVGIVFKLAQILLEEKMSQSLKKNFLELVAIATIADMMPQQGENKVFIEEGLFSLENSWRPGIRAFFEIESSEDFLLDRAGGGQVVSKIISLLNVRDIENGLPGSFRLLTSPSLNEAKEIISRLRGKAELRREKIRMITEEIRKRILDKEEPIIFEGDETFDLSLISSVASLLCREYQKLVFIFKKLTKESQGTVRTPSEINSVELMKKCKEYLISFGGHPQASGFRIKNENLEKFKECLIENYTNYMRINYS